ncbi:flagellar hook-length control protein FliK [Blastococcus sp. SYSU D01042]
MSAPVMPAAPAPRAATTGATSGSGGVDSAAPFASALDGALAEGRDAVGEGTPGDGEQPGSGAGEDAAVPPEAAALAVTAAVPLAPPVWALALGATTGTIAPETAGTGAAVAVAVAATVPGLPGAAALAGVPVPADTPPAGVPGLPAGAAPASATGLPPGLVVVPAPATEAAPGSAPASLPTLPGAGDPTAVGAAAVPLATGAQAPAGQVPAEAAGSSSTTPAGLSAATVPAAGTGADGTGTGDTGTGGSGPGTGGSSPGDEATAPAASVLPGAAPATAAPVPPAVAVPAGATGDAASLPVAGQVARQVAVLRGAPDGSHTMTLVLTPETLGPVEVSVTVTKGTVDLFLRGAHEQGRAALLDALPDLRRDLETAGLTTSRVEVARDSGGSWLDRHAAGQQAQQGWGDRPGQQGAPDGRSRSWLTPADSGETRTVPTTGTASSGVDVRV